MVVHYLARELTRLGHEVRILGATGWWRNRRIRFDYPAHRYPMLGKLFPLQLRYLYLAVDVLRFGADVIHAHATYPSGYQAVRMKKLLGVPVVITPHGDDINVVPEAGHGMRLNPRIAPLIERSLEGADAVTAISDTIERSILEVNPDAGKIVRIANGFDQTRLEKKVEADVFRWLKIPRGARLILSVGTISPRKGQEVIIRAMPQIVRHHPEAILVIVGRHSEKLLPLVRQLQLEKHVVTPGQIVPPFVSAMSLRKRNDAPSSDMETDWLAALYQQSTLYVSAGIKDGAEGLSLAVLDAMASGLPVVATEISGNRDIVQQGKNGILVEPNSADALAEAIGTLLKDEARRKSIAGRARESVTGYRWDNIAREYVSLYRDVCSRSARERT